MDIKTERQFVDENFGMNVIEKESINISASINETIYS